MYGEDDYSKRDSRPLSFVASPLHEPADTQDAYFDDKKPRRPSPSINGSSGKKAHTSPALLQSPRSANFEAGPLSPSLSLRRERQNSDPATAQFPLNDIDYESDPAAVAQELSNLQALRRMSMDVGQASDPDLPGFQGVSLMPSVAPTGDDDEDDPSRLFWVPARVHPELAPMEFKTFLENRVSTIKRRSGDSTTFGGSLSPDGVERSVSGGGLRRKKSMLSRQINNDGGRGAIGYKDGAEQLERKKSLSAHTIPELKIADLQELDALVRDPSKAMQKLSLETGSREGGDGAFDEDAPILPQAPGIGLRRSTRTTYRRGSLRKADRVPFSKRAGSIRGDTDGEESPTASPLDGRSGIGYPLTKVQSEPAPTEQNFSRPNRGIRRVQNLPQLDPTHSSSGSMLDDVLGNSTPASSENAPPQRSGSVPGVTAPRVDTPVPQIIETPPQEEIEPQIPVKQAHSFPERSSSQNSPTQPQPQQPIPDPPIRSNKRPGLEKPNTAPAPQNNARSTPAHSVSELSQHPSPLHGSSGRTDSLTFIPTAEEKKPEKKLKKERDDPEGPRKTSWGWFKGSDEKEKNKKKEEEAKKLKGKPPQDKSHDSTRLDLLQSTMDPNASSRGRESILLDRDSMDNKLQDERKKESSRKSSEGKKEKDGLFSSLFGGGKKKNDRDASSKKGSSLRTLSPEPPHRLLKPDVDYNWTRFSILEERAIYRMAHIKLANPKRALYSQVLLSNFMYSYLAKVQQMHPQMQVPQSAAQKKQEAEKKQRELEQRQRAEEEQRQIQQQQQADQYKYDYHQASSLFLTDSSSALLMYHRVLHNTRSHRQVRAPEPTVQIMSTIPRSMTTIIQSKIIPIAKIQIDLSPVHLSTTQRMATETNDNMIAMARSTTPTAATISVIEMMTTTMICGSLLYCICVFLAG